MRFGSLLISGLALVSQQAAQAQDKFTSNIPEAEAKALENVQEDRADEVVKSLKKDQRARVGMRT